MVGEHQEKKNKEDLRKLDRDIELSIYFFLYDFN